MEVRYHIRTLYITLYVSITLDVKHIGPSCGCTHGYDTCSTDIATK